MKIAPKWVHKNRFSWQITIVSSLSMICDEVMGVNSRITIFIIILGCTQLYFYGKIIEYGCLGELHYNYVV